MLKSRKDAILSHFYSVLFVAFFSLNVPAIAANSEADISLRPYIIETVRALNDVSSSLEVNYGGSKDSNIALKNLKVFHKEDLLVNTDLNEVLYGDEGRFSTINIYLEKLPPNLSYRYNHRDTPLDSALRDEGEIYRIYNEVLDLLNEAENFKSRQSSPSIKLIKFTMPLRNIFPSNEFSPGSSKTIDLVLEYVQDGVSYTKDVSHTITVAEQLPHVNFRLGEDGRIVEDTDGAWYYGDLHVHDCKDEAGAGRGCPGCDAEALNMGDDNTLADLKSQYIAYGATWFTSTSHGYCINSDEEYNEVRDECASLTDSDFLLIPDTEITSLEEGPQNGRFDWDMLLCGGEDHNHMGAHWIQSRKPGGEDYFLGFCDEPMNGFTENIAAIRAEGGFAIANHPELSAFGFNSFEWVHGWQDPNGLHGVEIWSARRGHVGWWVELLLRGELLYAYSGSDTHDDVFDFNWNHVYVGPEFTSDNLKSALNSGKVYISNYQSIVLYGRTSNTDRKMMGSVLNVPSDSSISVTLEILFDMGSKVGSIKIFEGHLGDTEETVLCRFRDVAGSGYKICKDESYTENSSYYRVYSETTDGYTAYSNPIFIIPE